jgi:lysophospholipase L1-like esterase
LEHATIEAEIERAQQRVASRFDCVTWNWQDLMGGPGGSYGWALARPPMMAVDLTHLSAAGYRETAHALAHSLGWEQ